MNTCSHKYGFMLVVNCGLYMKARLICWASVSWSLPVTCGWVEANGAQIGLYNCIDLGLVDLHWPDLGVCEPCLCERLNK